MKALRSFFAVVAGLAGGLLVLQVLYRVSEAVVPHSLRFEPNSEAGDSLLWLMTQIAVCFVSMFTGGVVAARIAPFAPFGHALSLGLVVLALLTGVTVMTLATAVTGTGPVWYYAGLVAAGGVGPALGGLLLARQQKWPSSP